MNLVQYAMSQGQNRRQFKNKLQAHLADKTRFNMGWEIERNPERKDLYLKIVKNIVSKDKSQAMMRRELLEGLKTSLWDYR